MWDNQHDASMRMQGCIFMYDKEPVYVVSVHERLGKLKAHVVSLDKVGEGEEHVEKVDLDSDKWDWKPVRTGYLNLDKKCFYVERYPVRKWKHGLHGENVYITGGARHRVMYTKQFIDTIKGNYKSAAECIKDLKKDKNLQGLAFARNYAFEKGELGMLWLSYRGEKVGWVEAGEPVLSEEYFYLIEDLTEARQ